MSKRCAGRIYADELGRPSIPPGVYFRMLLVGYFEGIDSQRGIAWRCADSLSLRSFLGVPIGESTPDHSSLTRIRERLPLEIHEEVFVFVLKLAHERKLLRGKTVAIDSTTLEANAAMRNIVRKDTGEDYKTYLKRLLAEEGVENATDEEARRFDKTRKKKTSNEEWESQSDPESKIAKMKDGRTHLAYKAEHAVDLDSGLLLSVEVLPATASDPSTVVDRAMDAELKLKAAGSDQTVDEVVADKGYHKAETLSTFEDLDTRTYIPEPEGRKYKRADHPEEHRRAAKANRRRMRGDARQAAAEAAKRVGGEELRSRVRDGRSQANMAARQREDQQAISGASGGLQPELADADVVRRGQTASAAGNGSDGRVGGLLRGESGRCGPLDRRRSRPGSAEE